MNDNMQVQVSEVQEVLPAMIQVLERQVGEASFAQHKKSKRGRPQEVEWEHICLGVLVSIVFGMRNYQQLWRRLRRKGLAHYEPIRVKDDAIIKRLKQAGTAPFEALLQQQRQGNESSKVQDQGCSMASFATEIVALDEMTGEQMQRYLKHQRSLAPGDKALLPGKLAGLFNVRTQQWDLVQWRTEAQANCKKNVPSLLEGLARGSLILFDLGYFSFAWFDYLTERGFWWVSRLREKTSYELVHTFYRSEGNLDALIWLGAHRSNQGGKMVRLVRFWDGEKLHQYISNVLHPHQLSMKEIAQLYARRWDIELAFLLLKQYLGLHHWWSSQPVLMEQQCLAALLVAQALQGLRLQMAAQAGVDAFEVSLPLVMEVLPELMMEREEPLNWMREHARDLGLIRASSRLVPMVPDVREEDLQMAPEGMQQERRARYSRYSEEDGEGDATVSKTGSAKERKKKKEAKKKEEERGKEAKKEGEGRKKKGGEQKKKEEEREKGKGKEKEEEKGNEQENQACMKRAEEEKEDEVRKGEKEKTRGGREEERKREETREKIRKKLQRFYEQQTKEKEKIEAKGEDRGKMQSSLKEGIPEFSG